MRKIILAGILAFFSHIAIAQKVAEGTGSNTDTTPTATKPSNTEEKLNKLENEMQTLKRDNETLKKQVGQLRSPSLNVKKKISVSRVGSKQVIVE
jgi:peptidoglycan hydrolase CwlO-like protein